MRERVFVQPRTPVGFSLPAVLELQLPHVLIVDDEPGIRFALKRWFARQHWSVSEAGDGQTAISQLLASDDASDSRVDLVICDLHLPIASGQDVLHALMSSRPSIAARFILCTGDAVSDAAPGTVLASHPHVLQKPFDLSVLKALVTSIIS